MFERPERGTCGPAAAALAWALCLLAAQPSYPADGAMGDPAKGQVLFATKGCVSCHAVRGAGGRVGPDLGRTAFKGSFFEIAANMWNHTLGMDQRIHELRMVRPTFENDEFEDLIAFIFFLNYFDEPGDPRLGKILFTEKHCILCHRVEGHGGREGPSLEELPRGVSPLRIAEGLWNHGPAMVRSIRDRGLAVPQFRGSEIVDLFAYLRSQGQGRVTREFQSAGDPEKGERLFTVKGCSRCHQVFGREFALAPDLGSSDLRGSVSQIAGGMWNHWSDMVEAMAALDMRLPTFRQDELADLLAYIFVSRYGGPPGSREHGEQVYRREGCAFCHGLAGEGTLGPPLEQVTPGSDKGKIIQNMWNHAPEMWESMGDHQLAWPRFEPRELADLMTFLSQLGSSETEGGR